MRLQQYIQTYQSSQSDDFIATLDQIIQKYFRSTCEFIWTRCIRTLGATILSRIFSSKICSSGCFQGRFQGVLMNYQVWENIPPVINRDGQVSAMCFCHVSGVTLTNYGECLRHLIDAHLNKIRVWRSSRIVREWLMDRTNKTLFSYFAMTIDIVWGWNNFELPERFVTVTSN